MKNRVMLSWAMTSLRIVAGWYFLYEGIAKLMTPGWTAKIYLMESRWLFAGFFHQLADNPGVMKVVNLLNIWGLILVGLSLFIGFLVRWSSIAGSLLLLFYFVAHPPIPGYTFGAVAEGSYLWVNKNLILLFILLVFTLLPSDIWYGADRLLKRWKEEKAHAPIPSTKDERTSLQRRELVRNLISVPFLGAFAYAVYKKRKWESFEEKFLENKPDATSGATLRNFNFTSLNDLKEQVPKGKIGDMELSRVILGGNVIGGWAHARDLLYASKLVKAYHTDERVMMTLQMAERCGINAFLSSPMLYRIVNKYWHETDGRIKFISDLGGGGSNSLLDIIRMSEEAGASAMYIHGGKADRLVRDGKFDEIAKALELIRSYGKPAGIGGHLLETVQGCVANGIKPDFWMKTLHHHNYWSARPDEESHDNIWCRKPQETIDFMNSLEEPWIAYKVLAAGAIHPDDGIRYAFENGADFVVLGMYDFQIVEDSNIVVEILNSDFMKNRKRRWLA